MKEWLGRIARRPEAPPVRRAKHPDPTLPLDQVRTVWQAVSWLLDYPSDEVLGMLDPIEQAASGLPAELRDPLLQLAGELRTTDLHQLRADYVATFDTTRRCALHLTYYAFGDTRKRGIALVQFKQAYRRGGWEVTEDELPDHLCVLLEFGATGDFEIAWRLLNDHRAGVEMLALALADRSSRWLAAITALRATLPELTGTQHEAVARLLAEGPPGEEVGLDGYSLDPRLNPHPADEPDLEGALR